MNTQPRNPSADLQKILIESQDYIQNDQESLSTVSNDGNLEEYLQKFTIEQVSEIRGKTTSKVSDNQTIEKMIALNKELQNSLKKDIKGVQKGLQKLHKKFDGFCSLLSDLLKILHPKIDPTSSEQSINSEDLYLTPLSLIAVTNILAERISGNPPFKRILMTKEHSQIRCYKCNKLGHIAKYCHNRKKSNFTTSKLGYNFYGHPKPLSNDFNL